VKKILTFDAFEKNQSYLLTNGAQKCSFRQSFKTSAFIKLVRRKEHRMYSTANGTVTDAQAAEIDSLNNEIWKNFWSIPREKRTKADWEKLLDIQILVKKG